jgi:phosphatidylglycerol:prolipoprotein diacylglycerol transferase
MAQRHADDLFFYCTLGIILGGRLGYATFYTGGDTGLPSLWAHPGELLQAVERRDELSRRLMGVVLAMAWVIVARRAERFLRVAIMSRCACRSGCCSGGWPTSSTASCGAASPGGRALGDGVPRCAGRCRAIPASFTKRLLEGAGADTGHAAAVLENPRALGARACWSGVFTPGWRWRASPSNIFREPDASCRNSRMRLGLSMGQWLTMPLILIGLFFVGPRAAAARRWAAEPPRRMTERPGMIPAWDSSRTTGGDLSGG